jgi:hypothetical protein
MTLAKKNKDTICRVGDLVTSIVYGNFDPYSIHEKYGIVILNSVDAYKKYVSNISPRSGKVIDIQDSGTVLVLWSTGLRRWHHTDELRLVNAAR